MSRKQEKALALLSSSRAGTRDGAVTPEDELVGRTEAARILGKSESTLRRLEQSALPPVVQNGVHRHSVRQLLAYKVEHVTVEASEERFDGAIAAAAFEQFDAGLGPADLVRALRLDPGLARDLHHEWADLRGTVVASGRAVVKLQEFWWAMEDELEIRTGDDLVRALEHISVTHCSGCKRRRARFCAGCLLQRHPRVVQAAEEAVQAAEAEARAAEQRRLRRQVLERAKSVVHRSHPETKLVKSSSPGYFAEARVKNCVIDLALQVR
jgi:hypothetical protein